MTAIDLNDPPVIPLESVSAEEVQSKMAQTVGAMPEIEDGGDGSVELPGGMILPNGDVARTAIVRELNGYDEERLSRVNIMLNPAKYETEMLVQAVEELGGGKPTRQQLTDLLIGDRDQLVLGIRKATYGPNVEFKLTCGECDNESDIVIDITDPTDVPVVKLEDPLRRTFDVQLKRSLAVVTLLTGTIQEAFSENVEKRTQAEINTIMLAKSVIEIDGVKTFGSEDSVRRLSVADRTKLQDFIAEHQPGPKLDVISVPCATCGSEFRIQLGLGNMFRF